MRAPSASVGDSEPPRHDVGTSGWSIASDCSGAGTAASDAGARGGLGDTRDRAMEGDMLPVELRGGSTRYAVRGLRPCARAWCGVDAMRGAGGDAAGAAEYERGGVRRRACLLRPLL